VEISLHNRQRKVPVPLVWLRDIAPSFAQEALKHPAWQGAPLSQLGEVEVTFISDAKIAEVHQEFMDIPGATDVITFDHGEIVISAETAKANAAVFGRTLDEELARYIVHGLLHLNGHEDKEAGEAARMHEIQEEILAKCIAQHR